MKRLTTTLALLAAALYATAQEATLPTPDAKALGMGGVAMTTLSGSHAIYNNSATAIFSQMPSQVSSSYYGQGEFDYYAVTGFCRFDNVNLAQIGWRQYLRERVCQLRLREPPLGTRLPEAVFRTSDSLIGTSALDRMNHSHPGATAACNTAASRVVQARPSACLTICAVTGFTERTSSGRAHPPDYTGRAADSEAPMG